MLVLLLRKLDRDDLGLFLATRCEGDEELFPLFDVEAFNLLELSIVEVCEDRLLVDLGLEAEPRVVATFELRDEILLAEPVSEFDGRLHLAEADLADGVRHGLEPASEATIQAPERHHHFLDELFLNFEVLRELRIALVFERLDALPVRLLDTQMREGLGGKLREKRAHAPCSLGVVDDIIQIRGSHVGPFPCVLNLLHNFTRRREMC